MFNIRSFLRDNQAAIYNNIGLLSRTLSGPLIVLLLTSELSPNEQGLYYAFLSIAGIQLIFELGFSTAIVQHLAHSKPNKSFFKTYSLLGYTFFKFSSILLFFTLIIYGNWYFHDINVNQWQIQWVVFSFFLSLNVYLSILYIIKEGKLEYVRVYEVRLYSSLIYSLVLALSLLFGAKLWSLAISQFSTLLITIYFLIIRDKEKLYPKYKICRRRIYWSFRSIIKFQSKLAVIWITGYFYWNTFTLFYFKYESPEFAGKIAISIAVLAAISGSSASFVRTKRALYSKLISEGKVNKAKDIFLKSSVLGLSIYIFITTIFAVVIFTLSDNYYVLRFVDFELLLLLILFRLLVLCAELMATFLRAYRDEPLFNVTLITNLSVPITVVACYITGLTENIFQIVVLFHVASTAFQFIRFKEYTRLKAVESIS